MHRSKLRLYSITYHADANGQYGFGSAHDTQSALSSFALVNN
jgi:hypothetical protein